MSFTLLWIAAPLPSSAPASLLGVFSLADVLEEALKSAPG